MEGKNHFKSRGTLMTRFLLRLFVTDDTNVYNCFLYIKRTIISSWCQLMFVFYSYLDLSLVHVVEDDMEYCQYVHFVLVFGKSS